MTIRCIAFDLDDTLWECHPVILRAEQRFYDWLDKTRPAITRQHTLDSLLEHRISYMRDNEAHRHNLTYLRKQWMRSLAEEHEEDDTWIESGFRVFWLARNEVTFFDGTLEILEQLTNRFTLGVISNGNADIHHIGVGHLFKFALSSERAGVAKPHGDIFHQAAQLSGHPVHECVYVGDDPERDVLGAKQAGMKAIWYNPALKPWPGGMPPDAVIRSLHELQDKLEKL